MKQVSEMSYAELKVEAKKRKINFVGKSTDQLKKELSPIKSINKQSGDIFKFTKRNGIEYIGTLVKEKEYDGINYYFLKDESGKTHQINPKNCAKI